MSDVIANLFNGFEANFDDDTLIVDQFLDFNGNQTDENAKVHMNIEALAGVRRILTTKIFKLADTLDATNAKHAEEMATIQEEHADQLNVWKQKCTEYEMLIEKLQKDNDTQSAKNHQFIDFLKSICDCE